MKRFLIALGCIVALSACATGYVSGGGGYRYYDGYYDDFYGPVSDGYWNSDGFFYYRSAPTAVYVRDDARHFRRDVMPNGHRFHMRGERPHR